MNLYMEVAKLRAARKLWATLMRERMGAKDPQSLLCVTLGVGGAPPSQNTQCTAPNLIP